MSSAKPLALVTALLTPHRPLPTLFSVWEIVGKDSLFLPPPLSLFSVSFLPSLQAYLRLLRPPDSFSDRSVDVELVTVPSSRSHIPILSSLDLEFVSITSPLFLYPVFLSVKQAKVGFLE